jgi:CRP-like cAMP-binding protein
MSAAGRPSPPPPERERLAEYPIFHGLSEAQLEEAGALLRVEEHPAGELVWDEGDEGDDVALLLEGEVEISQHLTLFSEGMDMEETDKSIIHLRAEQRPVIGEIALCAHVPRSAALRAVSDVRLGLLRAADLESAFAGDPGFGHLFYRNLASIVSHRLIEANRNVLKLTTAFSLALQQGR